MDGLLLIDKPTDWTSFDVVNRVRRLVEMSGLNTTGRKRFPVGHAGTLDPLATGLMIVMLGNYTKRAQEFTKLDKSYRAVARLGATSTTGDEEGEKTTVSSQKPTLAEVQAALQQFTGQIQQVPPIYSAVKVNGKRAYKLAREGKAPELAPRTVTIYDITEVEYEYPELTFTVQVSSGTYIRSLVEDMGKALRTGAYTHGLRRTTIGAFNLEKAVPVDKLSPEVIYQNLQAID